MGKIRQFEDAHSDPDLIASKYRVGRNAYFEVELVMAELSNAMTTRSSGGGNQGSTDVILFEGMIDPHGGGMVRDDGRIVFV